MHKYKFNDPLAYLHYNQNSQGLIGKPFHELINIQYNDLYTNSFVSFFIFIFIGHVFVYTKSIPIGIFSTIYLFYISCLNHIDIYRYSIPCSLFAIFIGFDPIFSQRQTIKALIILSPIYFIFAFIYVKGQIHSNVAVPFFYRELFTILVADIFKQEPIILHRLQHPLPHSATALLLLKHPGIAQIHCLSPRFDFYIENLFQQPLLSNGLNNHFRHIINHFIGHTRIYTNPECIFHNEICIF